MRSNPIGGDSRTILYTKGDGSIYIDDFAAISNTTIVSSKKVYIGQYTNIGASVKIYDTDFHSICADDRLNGDTNVLSKEVFIGSKVFVGAHSIILKGTRIGDNSVIGAGSVVTGSIPPNEIWAGNPAKFIKHNRV